MTSPVAMTVLNEIANMIAISPTQIDPSAPLNEVGVDSLQALHLLVMLERTYKVAFAESDLQLFTSVNRISELVTERLPSTVENQA